VKMKELLVWENPQAKQTSNKFSVKMKLSTN